MLFSGGKGGKGVDGWRMMAIDDIGTDFGQLLGNIPALPYCLGPNGLDWEVGRTMRLSAVRTVSLVCSNGRGHLVPVGAAASAAALARLSVSVRRSTLLLERQPMKDLVRDGKLHSYCHGGFWQPMDTYQKAMHLNKLWSEGKAPWKVW